MWGSKDIGLVIALSVTGFVYTLFVFQLGFLVTGIPGSNYLFLVGQAIWITLTFLLFKGKRWRLTLAITIFGLLTLPTSAMGAPYNLVPRIPLILNAIQSDLIMNTIYLNFKKIKLNWFVILFVVEHFLVDSLFRVLMYPFFYSPDYVSLFLGVFSLMFPIIIIESVVGGFVAYRVYLRIIKSSKLEILDN